MEASNAAPVRAGASFCRGFGLAVRLFSFPGPDDYGVGAEVLSLRITLHVLELATQLALTR
jgi:hypothetical protein